MLVSNRFCGFLHCLYEGKEGEGGVIYMYVRCIEGDSMYVACIRVCSVDIVV